MKRKLNGKKFIDKSRYEKNGGVLKKKQVENLRVCLIEKSLIKYANGCN